MKNLKKVPKNMKNREKKGVDFVKKVCYNRGSLSKSRSFKNSDLYEKKKSEEIFEVAWRSRRYMRLFDLTIR